MDELAALRRRFEEAVRGARDERTLEEVRVVYLGRSGEITAVRRSIGHLPAAERPAAGKTINDAVESMERVLVEHKNTLRAHELERKLAERIDVTFPAIPGQNGSIHPVRRVLEDACSYFERHGFAVVVGPEIEPAYYNFDALNIPEGHPAREGFDSFWIDDSLLLRPHTSPMQVRTMQQHPPPIAIVVFA
jgi:phenylalanyl-tRNA synthetase alpha chain